MSKVRWKWIYYPVGGWVYEDGQEATIIGNFRCTYAGRLLIAVMAEVKSSGGHGDPASTGLGPTFIDSETLINVTVPAGALLEVAEL